MGNILFFNNYFLIIDMEDEIYLGRDLDQIEIKTLPISSAEPFPLLDAGSCT